VITGLISATRHAGLPEEEEEEAVRTVRSGMAGGARKPRLIMGPDLPGWPDRSR
jgi:hypothetical protein